MMKNSVKHNAGKNLLAQSSESNGSHKCTFLDSSDEDSDLNFPLASLTSCACLF